MQEKLGATMHAVGYSTICNNIIEYPLKVFEEGSYGGSLKTLLRKHVLCAENRFDEKPRLARTLIRQFYIYASPKSMTILEGIWREVITEWVLEECISPSPTHFDAASQSSTVASLYVTRR